MTIVVSGAGGSDSTVMRKSLGVRSIASVRSIRDDDGVRTGEAARGGIWGKRRERTVELRPEGPSLGILAASAHFGISTGPREMLL
jgi:hypothetical protein